MRVLFRHSSKLTAIVCDEDRAKALHFFFEQRRPLLRTLKCVIAQEAINHNIIMRIGNGFIDLRNLRMGLSLHSYTLTSRQKQDLLHLIRKYTDKKNLYITLERVYDAEESSYVNITEIKDLVSSNLLACRLKKLIVSGEVSAALRKMLHDEVKPLLQLYRRRRTIVKFFKKTYFT